MQFCRFWGNQRKLLTSVGYYGGPYVKVLKLKSKVVLLARGEILMMCKVGNYGHSISHILSLLAACRVRMNHLSGAHRLDQLDFGGVRHLKKLSDHGDSEVRQFSNSFRRRTPDHAQ